MFSDIKVCIGFYLEKFSDGLDVMVKINKIDSTEFFI